MSVSAAGKEISSAGHDLHTREIDNVFKNYLFRYRRERRLPEKGLPHRWWQNVIDLEDEHGAEWNRDERHKVVLDSDDAIEIVGRVQCDAGGAVVNGDFADLDDSIDELVLQLRPDGELA